MSQVPLLERKGEIRYNYTSSIRCCTAQVDDAKKLATSADATVLMADATVLMVDADQLIEAESHGKSRPSIFQESRHSRKI